MSPSWTDPRGRGELGLHDQRHGAASWRSTSCLASRARRTSGAWRLSCTARAASSSSSGTATSGAPTSPGRTTRCGAWVTRTTSWPGSGDGEPDLPTAGTVGAQAWRLGHALPDARVGGQTWLRANLLRDSRFSGRPVYLSDLSACQPERRAVTRRDAQALAHHGVRGRGALRRDADRWAGDCGAGDLAPVERLRVARRLGGALRRPAAAHLRPREAERRRHILRAGPASPGVRAAPRR